MAVACGWSRELRIPGALGAGMGAAVVFAGCRGMCLILLTLGKAQDRPWGATTECTGSLQDVGADLEKGGMRIVGGRLRWMKQYKRRWLLSRVFLERERKVEARFVREGQMVVLWQAVWVWVLVTVGLLVVLLPIPRGGGGDVYHVTLGDRLGR